MKLSIFIVFFCVVSVFSGELFKDDFNGKELKKEWIATDGKWRIGPTKMLEQIIGGPHRVGNIRLNVPLKDSFYVQASFSYLGGQSKNGFGAGFHLCVPEAEGVFYALTFAPIGKSGLNVMKVFVEKKDGKLKNRYCDFAIAETMIFEQGEKYVVKVEYCKGMITVWIDGEEIFEKQDTVQPVPTNGMVRLFTYGAAAAFDDLVVGE